MRVYVVRIWPEFIGIRRKGWRFGIGFWKWALAIWLK